MLRCTSALGNRHAAETNSQSKPGSQDFQLRSQRPVTDDLDVRVGILSLDDLHGAKQVFAAFLFDQSPDEKDQLRVALTIGWLKACAVDARIVNAQLVLRGTLPAQRHRE